MTKYLQTTKQENIGNTKMTLRKFSKPILFFFLGTVIVASVAVYLFEVNYIAAKGFYMRDLEKQISDVQYENEKLQLQAIEMRSMSDLSQKIEQLGMEPVDEITYFDTAGQVVARR